MSSTGQQESAGKILNGTGLTRRDVIVGGATWLGTFVATAGSGSFIYWLSRRDTEHHKLDATIKVTEAINDPQGYGQFSLQVKNAGNTPEENVVTEISVYGAISSNLDQTIGNGVSDDALPPLVGTVTSSQLNSPPGYYLLTVPILAPGDFTEVVLDTKGQPSEVTVFAHSTKTTGHKVWRPG